MYSAIQGAEEPPIENQEVPTVIDTELLMKRINGNSELKMLWNEVGIPDRAKEAQNVESILIRTRPPIVNESYKWIIQKDGITTTTVAPTYESHTTSESINEKMRPNLVLALNSLVEINSEPIYSDPSTRNLLKTLLVPGRDTQLISIEAFSPEEMDLLKKGLANIKTLACIQTAYLGSVRHLVSVSKDLTEISRSNPGQNKEEIKELKKLMDQLQREFIKQLAEIKKGLAIENINQPTQLA